MIIFCLVCKEKISLSIMMAIGTCLHWSKQEEDVLGLTNAKCHLPTL